MNKFFSTIAAIATVFMPVAVHAEASEPRSFTFRGETYTYTTEQVGSKKVLRGRVVTTGAPFELRVGARQVEGTVNGNPVSFPLKAVARLRGIEEVAVR
jgi:hypothetical protein